LDRRTKEDIKAGVYKQSLIVRHWSNKELRRLAPLFSGDVLNLSGWKDEDKQGGTYREYFKNATSYTISNCPGEDRSSDIDEACQEKVSIDLMAEIPDGLKAGFDVVFNHTVLEHVFDCFKAFANMCLLSRDVIISVVPFSQLQHDANVSYGDYWRFCPAAMRKLYSINGLSIIYESAAPFKDAAIYLLFVGARHPAVWKTILPDYKPLTHVGEWIGLRKRKLLDNQPNTQQLLSEFKTKDILQNLLLRMIQR